jgi:hypothetical protein
MLPGKEPFGLNFARSSLTRVRELAFWERHTGLATSIFRVSLRIGKV